MKKKKRKRVLTGYISEMDIKLLCSQKDYILIPLVTTKIDIENFKTKKIRITIEEITNDKCENQGKGIEREDK
jgi:hypothetical protein